MTTQQLLTPTALSYAASLRGVKPRSPGAAFVYVNINCTDADYLACLAASNPEGKFYGIVGNELALAAAKNTAASHKVDNVTFMYGSAAEILSKLKNGLITIPAAEYVTFDALQESGTSPDRTAIFDLAAALLSPSGLFGYRYRVANVEDGHLRFLIQEFAPEMSAEQALVFLNEIKTMGGFYFAAHKDQAAQLDKAIAAKQPDEFFSKFSDDEAQSSTFDTMVELAKRGFAFAGDSNVPSNYIELSVPSEAQELIFNSREHILYEPIKDFALNRLVRADIWCKQPAVQSGEPAELIGGFTFGTTVTREQVPSEVKAQGKIIPLNSPLYEKLLSLMFLMPITIGDFLSHEFGKIFTPSEVVEAVQILVACGVVRPMRGLSQNDDVSNISQPRLAGNYNQYLSDIHITSAEVRLASTIVGAPVTVSAREALVMQALARAGMADSVSALMPELEQLITNPALASRVMDTPNPTPEDAQSMIQDTVNRSIVQWYALGLLKAA